MWLKLKMAKSKFQKNKCWEFGGYKTTKGYGHIMINRKNFTAHRLAYLLFNFPAQGNMSIRKMHVLHRCDNSSCINPDHLFLGTNYDNVLDRNKKGRQARGESHARHKVTAKEVNVIRGMFLTGVSQKEINKRFPQIDNTNISRIINRKTWRHI